VLFSIMMGIALTEVLQLGSNFGVSSNVTY